MTTQSGNPFLMPGMGLGTTPEQIAGNPVLQSMDLMRQAWTSMGSGVSSAPPTLPLTSPEELDKRIAELRAVESWLRLNLNMLTSSIQAMEVQSATIGTLRSFAQSMTASVPTGQPGTSGGSASPLEVVLGLKPGAAPQARAPSAQPAPAEPAPEPARAAPPEAPPAADAASAPVGDSGLPPQQAWWDLLQDQFNRIAVAAAASMPKAPAASDAASPTPADAEPATARRPSAPRKAAPRKAAPRKRSSATKA